jgi:hypothetical protein
MILDSLFMILPTMKKLNPILIVIIVAAAVAVIGYAYVVARDRYFNKAETGNEKQETSTQDNTSNGGYLGDAPQDNTGVGSGNLNSSTGTSNGNGNFSNGLIGVTSADCDNGCAKYKEEGELKYCRQICGLSAGPNANSSGDCSQLSGLDKDYCYKDQAVSKKDYKTCNQIQDSKVKKVCKDRITEDLIN